MEPTVIVRGRIVFAGTAEGDKARPAATISMTPEDGISGSWTRSLSATSKDGAFAIENVVPARYRLSASLAPAAAQAGTWWFASATIGGTDVTDTPVEIRPGQPLDEIVVTFGDRPTTVTGSVMDAGGTAASGFPVVVFSTNRNDWRCQASRIRHPTR